MPKRIGLFGQISRNELVNVLIDQRPEWIAAQTGQGAERNCGGATLATQQPGADTRYAIVPAARQKAVSRVVGREGQGNMAE